MTPSNSAFFLYDSRGSETYASAELIDQIIQVWRAGKSLVHKVKSHRQPSEAISMYDLTLIDAHRQE